jgi:hypothetical protein
MPHVYGTCYIFKPCSGFLQRHLRSYHQWYVFLLAMPPSLHSLRFITQALGFKNINGESIQSVLEMLFNRVLYPTDPWNMVSITRCFPFLVAQGILNRCSNSRIVCSSPYFVGPTNLHTCITLVYSRPSVRLSPCSLFGGHSSSFRVITSSRAYRDLFQYITG